MQNILTKVNTELMPAFFTISQLMILKTQSQQSWKMSLNVFSLVLMKKFESIGYKKSV